MRHEASVASLDPRREICGVWAASPATEANDRETVPVAPAPVRADKARAAMNRQERIDFWTYMVCLGVCLTILLAVGVSAVLT